MWPPDIFQKYYKCNTNKSSYYLIKNDFYIIIIMTMTTTILFMLLTQNNKSINCRKYLSYPVLTSEFYK